MYFHHDLLESVCDSLSSDERQELIRCARCVSRAIDVLAYPDGTNRILFQSERRVRKEAGGSKKAKQAMAEQFAGMVAMMTVQERKSFIKTAALGAGHVRWCRTVHANGCVLISALPVQDVAVDILSSVHVDAAQCVPSMLEAMSYEDTEEYYQKILANVDPNMLIKLIPEEMWPVKE